MRELLRISSQIRTGRPVFLERPAMFTCRALQVPDHMCPCWVNEGFNFINAQNLVSFHELIYIGLIEKVFE